MTILFILLVILFTGFMLWLGSIILAKAGIDKAWVFCLLIPFVNIIAVWAFAFLDWPNSKNNKKVI